MNLLKIKSIEKDVLGLRYYFTLLYHENCIQNINVVSETPMKTTTSTGCRPSHRQVSWSATSKGQNETYTTHNIQHKQTG